MSLQVESADDYYQEWRDRVAIRRPPGNESWGARTFDVIDPFGNTIFVIGPMVVGRRPLRFTVRPEVTVFTLETA